MRCCVWSRNLVNEGALAHWGCRAESKQKDKQPTPINAFHTLLHTNSAAGPIQMQNGRAITEPMQNASVKKLCVCVCVCVCVFKSRRASLRHTFVPRGLLNPPQYRSKKKIITFLPYRMRNHLHYFRRILSSDRSGRWFTTPTVPRGDLYIVQGDSERNVNILKVIRPSIDRKKKLHMNMSLILNGYLIQHHKRKSCLCGWI